MEMRGKKAPVLAFMPAASIEAAKERMNPTKNPGL